MSEKVIDLKRRAQHNLHHNWGLQRVLERRKALLRMNPMSDEVTKLDLWLVEQPLPLSLLMKIWKRAMHAEWVLYGTLTRPQKHAFLLRLRELYFLEYCGLPASLKKLRVEFEAKWHEEFLAEEEEEANGAA